MHHQLNSRAFKHATNSFTQSQQKAAENLLTQSLRKEEYQHRKLSQVAHNASRLSTWADSALSIDPELQQFVVPTRPTVPATSDVPTTTTVQAPDQPQPEPQSQARCPSKH
eukprot:TRINITY_DN9697_c0_g1_i2.p2 TRINITY_DN9697_c0_g1~~TRINITY_DN9697_c0_g1_i2.p2  ORF type:complete len:111 (+),score=22.47 TRINITY_DN9697_c0_g1_i2:365-697(+)